MYDSETEEQPNANSQSEWEIDDGYSLLSKPAIDMKSNIVCGSDEGYLYSIKI